MTVQKNSAFKVRDYQPKIYMWLSIVTASIFWVVLLLPGAPSPYSVKLGVMSFLVAVFIFLVVVLACCRVSIFFDRNKK